jgi:hypothetical protein
VKAECVGFSGFDPPSITGSVIRWGEADWTFHCPESESVVIASPVSTRWWHDYIENQTSPVFIYFTRLGAPNVLNASVARRTATPRSL